MYIYYSDTSDEHLKEEETAIIDDCHKQNGVHNNNVRIFLCIISIV